MTTEPDEEGHLSDGERHILERLDEIESEIADLASAIDELKEKEDQ